MTAIVALLDADFHGLLQRNAAPAPLGGVLRILPSQSAVFVAQGRVAGVLGPGEHPLDPNQIAFLAPIVQQRPTGPIVGDDLIWVKTGAITSMDVATALDTRTDPALGGEKVTPKLQLRLHVSVADPARLLTELAGNADRAKLDQALRNHATVAAKTAAGQVQRLVDLVNPKGWPALEQAATAALGPALAQSGIALSRFEVTQITVPDEIASRLRLLASSGTQPGNPQAATAAFRASPGARVRMTRDGRWYSGTVIEVVEGQGQARIDWDPGGAPAWGPLLGLEAEPAYPGSHTPGTRVVGRFGDGNFYPAVVKLFNGTQYQVAFDNGTIQWLEPGHIRLP